MYSIACPRNPYASPFYGLRRATQTVLVGLTLSTTVLLTPVPAKTVIAVPPIAPLPPTSEVDTMAALLTTLQTSHASHCLSPVVGVVVSPYLTKVCGTLELLIESVQRELTRLCTTPIVPLGQTDPACPQDPSTSLPWTGQVE